MADTSDIFDRCKESKIDIWLDKAQYSSNINLIDMSLLTWLMYHDVRTHIGY